MLRDGVDLPGGLVGGACRAVGWAESVLTPLLRPCVGLALGGLWGLREGIRKPVLPAKGTATVASTSAAPAAAATAAAPATATATAPAASAVGAQATAFAKDAAAAAATTPEGTAARPAPRVSARLRWNNILNQVTRRGSFAGNTAGVLGRLPMLIWGVRPCSC